MLAMQSLSGRSPAIVVTNRRASIQTTVAAHSLKFVARNTSVQCGIVAADDGERNRIGRAGWKHADQQCCNLDRE